MPRKTTKRTSPSRLTDNGQLRNGPPEEADDDEGALELPVEPDEGTPLIPDDERVVNIPS